MTTYHVAKNGSDTARGTQTAPFLTINQAAATAVAGDDIIVHEGVYREWVKPRSGGLSDQRRITYAAANGEHVTIKGSEQVTGWQHEAGSVWRATLPNSLFGDFNPYQHEIEGDWVVRPTPGAEPAKHLGDVFLNGTSLYEVTSRDALIDPPRRDLVTDDRTGRSIPITNPDSTRLVWYAQVDAKHTTIWANFAGADPNAELIEINVRRSVFYPDANHLDYITVRGFELAHAASPWAPPTGNQPGLIGPNWAKGWIIEDNVIHDAKCSAISIGKEASTGDNYFTRRHDKPGYQYQLESVFSARHVGWTKEHIGSHIIRNNTIYNCGQNGIVGHLGCIFSQIYGNHIYSIATKREFYGHEIGGIKLHAAIDVQIHHNRIHDCALGVWSDWQTQGTRFSSNLFYRNCRDLYVEVSHGPYLVDHNIFASPAAIETMSDGGAYVNNLIAGTVLVQSVMDRATPYHVPHSTEVAGYAVIYSGDDRFIGNIFVGNGGDPFEVSAAYMHGLEPHSRVCYGTACYNTHPASFQEYLDNVKAALPGDLDVYLNLRQPVYIHDNVYLNDAAPYERETNASSDSSDARMTIDDQGDKVFLEIILPDGFESCTSPIVTTADLGRVRFPDAEFESPDGSPLHLDTDLLGAIFQARVVSGPIATLTAGHNRTRIWGV